MSIFLAYIQQVGRAGRRGNQATAILFFNNSDTGRPEMTIPMKTFCQSETVCRRQMLSEYFGFSSQQGSEQFLCCDICDSSLAKWDSPLPLSMEIKFALREALTIYMSGNEIENYSCKIEQILHNYSMYIETANLVADFSFNHIHAENVSSIIQACASL
jgi:superfamily II DNA helicase RecQ